MTLKVNEIEVVAYSSNLMELALEEDYHHWSYLALYNGESAF